MKSTGFASWQGDLFGGSGTASLNSGAAGPLPVSWASRTEEAAGKTSPEELIAAAHAACYSMALSNVLAGAGNPPENLDTKAVAKFEKTDAGFRITTMALSVVGTVPGMSAEDFATHAAAAKDGCPVSNALVGNVEITLEASLA
ncbi:MAG: OsmC family peroxiredoxin [Acidimicrobiia bacterium]|nr:OsmC family peroxiredoxin [Acidimicrobiia bacterium]